MPETVFIVLRRRWMLRKSFTNLNISKFIKFLLILKFQIKLSFSVFNAPINLTAWADFSNVVAERKFYAHVASDAMFRRPAWLCLRFASCVTTQQNATFLEVTHPGGGYDPQIWTPRRFCTMHLPPSFIVPCLLVRKLSCLQTNPHANKQIPAKTSNFLRYATTLGKNVLRATSRVI